MAISRRACEQNAKTSGGESVTVKGDANWLNRGAPFSGLLLASSPRQRVTAGIYITENMCLFVLCGFQSRQRLISLYNIKVLIVCVRNE